LCPQISAEKLNPVHPLMKGSSCAVLMMKPRVR
jgi:hypothetical protein